MHFRFRTVMAGALLPQVFGLGVLPLPRTTPSPDHLGAQRRAG